GLSRVEDASQRAAIAQQIFGRSGTRLLPLISAGAAGVEELQQQARSLGLTISTQTARDAANFTNQMNILRKVLRITSITIGAALAPAMESIVARGTRIGVMITDWIRKNQEVVVTVARVALGVTLLGGALLATGLAIQVAAFAVGGLATAVTVVGAVVGALTSPLALATAGVAVLGFGFIRAAGRSEQAADVMNSVVGFLSRRFASLRETVNATIGGIGDALAAGDISLAARVLWNGIKVAFLDGTRDIQEIFAEGLTTLRLVFVDVLGGMTRTWFRFQSGIRGAQEETGSFLARQWVRIQGIFDEGLDVDRALKDLDDIARSNARNRDAALEQDLRDADRTQAARTQAVLELASEGIDRRSRALRRARDELEAALADARRQREASLAADTPDFIRRFSDLIDDLDNIGQDIVRRVEVRSTFNPALIGRLLGVGGDAVADRTARASEETARNTKRIAQSAESGGASFA
ncbi:MAG: phage tail tape measure protein, partial [Phycisphaeraceae bacterium]